MKDDQAPLVKRDDPGAGLDAGADPGPDAETLSTGGDAPIEPPRSGADQRNHVKKRVFSASLWSVASSLGTQASTFIIFIILARLLSPKDFGLVALASSFIDLSRSVILGGIPEALIQRKEWEERVANTAFWLNVIGGLLFTGAILAICGGAALMGSDSELWLVFAALSSTLVIDGLRGVHEARLRREFDYKKLAARSVIASIVGGVAGVAMAWGGFGVWALVGNRVVTATTQTLIIWTATHYRPRLVVDRAEVKPLLSFSSEVLAGRLLGQLNQRLADMILGIVAGATVLGFYRVGSRSLNFIVQATVVPLQTTTLSAFARLDAAGQARAYNRFTQMAAAMTFPAFFGSCAIAPDFILVAFGEKWAASAPVMMILTLGVLPLTLNYFFQPAMQARGRPRAAIGPEAFKVAAGAAILGVAGRFGILASATGDVARKYVALPNTLRVLKRELNVAPKDLLLGILPPLLCAAAMAGVILGLRATLWSDMQPVLRLALSIGLGGVVYVGGMRLFARTYLLSVFGSLRPGLPKPLQNFGDAVLGRSRG